VGTKDTSPVSSKAFDHRGSVSTRIILVQTIVVLVVMAANGTITYIKDSQRLNASLHQREEQMIKRLPSNLATPLWNVDVPSLDSVITTEMMDPDVQAIIITTTSGTSGRIRNASGAPVAWNERDRPSLRAPGLTDLKAGITYRGEDIGTVDIFLSDRSIGNELRATLFQTVLLVIFVIGLLSLSTQLIIRILVARPLRLVDRALMQIAGGDLNKLVSFPSSNEIGLLARTFNIMAEKLQRTMEDLRQSEEKFRIAFRSIPVSTTLSRLSDGTYLDVNEGFTRSMGYTAEEVLGKTALELGIWDSLADRERLLQELRTTGQVVDFQVRLRRKDGGITIGLMSARILSIGGEKVLLSLLRDITTELELEEKFRQAQKMEAVGRLAGGVAHDFNNLLIPMLSYSEMLKETLQPEDNRNEMLNEIIHAGERAAGLTRQILAFSRKQVLDMKALDLSALVQDIKKMMERLLPENVEIQTKLEPGIWVLADPIQVEQILMNLAVNASDAMPNGGTLSITTTAELLDSTTGGRFADDPVPGRYAVMAVRDTGHGMDAETVGHIFEPFFTTKDQGKGTGLGLATVFGIVKQHQGHIWVYSEPGYGTTFKIYLPILASAGITTPAAAPEPKSLEGTETIMVVEDDEHVRSLVCQALKSHSYNVIVPRNANDAVGLIDAATSENHPQLLLTDVIMPGMNGVELQQKISARVPTIRVLFMSGYTDDVIARHKLIEKGANFLQKPFAVRDLLRKVRTILDG
jgi:PAS domain S-box-containing protein